MIRFVFWMLALVGAAIGGFSVGQAISGKPGKKPPSVPIAWTDSLYELHTVRLEGALLPAVTSMLTERLDDGPAILIALDGVDLSNCGDLGRQIRELDRAVGSEIPILVTADDTSTDELEWFLRKERLALRITGVEFDELLGSRRNLPTPAAIWLDADLDYGIGVGHILRYPYIRIRSFAAELSPLYTPFIGDRPVAAIRESREVSAATFR